MIYLSLNISMLQLTQIQRDKIECSYFKKPYYRNNDYLYQHKPSSYSWCFERNKNAVRLILPNNCQALRRHMLSLIDKSDGRIGGELWEPIISGQNYNSSMLMASKASYLPIIVMVISLIQNFMWYTICESIGCSVSLFICDRWE